MYATPLICEIIAPRAAQASALAEIAATCARDVAQPLEVKSIVIGKRSTAPVLTLQLPVELASSQDKVWCLACQLACFCPDARVSVLIQSEASFGPPPTSVKAAWPA